MTDDNGKGYKVNLDASLEPKVSKYKPDGSLDMSEPIGDEFDNVLDQLNDLYVGNARSRGHHREWDEQIIDARKEQELVTFLNNFQASLHKSVQEQLQGAGIIVNSVQRDESGFFVVFTDRQGRNYRPVSLTVDEALGYTELKEERAFREVVQRVCVKILQSRDAFVNEIEAGVKRFMGN